MLDVKIGDPFNTHCQKISNGDVVSKKFVDPKVFGSLLLSRAFALPNKWYN